MKLLKQKSGLTLIELVVSVALWAVVLLIATIFIADSIEVMTLSNKKTEVVKQWHDLVDKLNRYTRGGFSSFTGFINHTSWLWTDVMLLKNIDSSKWVIFWVVDTETMKLESNTGTTINPAAATTIYSDQVLWYAELDATQITQIESSSWATYDVPFHEDKIFDALHLKDFQVSYYNSGAIMDVDLTVFFYVEEFDGIPLSMVSSDNTIQFILDF